MDMIDEKRLKGDVDKAKRENKKGPDQVVDSLVFAVLHSHQFPLPVTLSKQCFVVGDGCVL